MIEFDLSDVHRAFWALEDAMPAACGRAVRESLDDAKKKAVDVAPRKSGALVDGILDPSVTLTPNGANGVLVASAAHSAVVSEGSRPHRIVPRKRQALRWEGAGGLHFSKGVSHPGTKPNDFWRQAERTAEQSLESATAAEVEALCRKV